MPVTTGLSGNEIYCLGLKGLRPGNLVVGNSVHSLGMLRGITTGIKTILGGELEQITKLIEDGRETALKRVMEEAQSHQATGMTGVTSELIFHGGNIEFLSIGSVVHADSAPPKASPFSTSADGQELFAQLDMGFTPLNFAFGNVAYSMGIGRSLLGGLKTFQRGEIKEYSDMFNHTRHLALQRIIEHAKQSNANAVLGIRTSIIPFGNIANEMLMLGTASHSDKVADIDQNGVVTSDMTNVEMWNMANAGYAPIRLLLGTSVYSLGLIGGITSSLKSLVRGEINELTRLVYDARENAIDIINREAKEIGADDVVGVKVYVYQLQGGLIEFLAIGTAVKKIPDIKTESAQLPVQAIVVDKDTFYDSIRPSDVPINLNAGTNVAKGLGWLVWLMIILGFILWQTLIYYIHK